MNSKRERRVSRLRIPLSELVVLRVSPAFAVATHAVVHGDLIGREQLAGRKVRGEVNGAQAALQRADPSR
jgi:hypothetical protein